MESKKETAVEKFKKGYNCCQAVACTYCEELGIPEKDMFRLAEGFGSGIGGLKDTCGAVMGMFLADVGFLIKYAIDKHKEKKRKKNEESADKAE